MIASSIKAEVVKANARAANDTGSPEVQVALLTARSNVAVSVFGPQIVQQFTTTTHHAQQTAATVMVFGVCFEMGCQLVDASCEQSHLDFGATRVIGGASVGLDDLSLDRGCNHFFFLFSPLNQSSNAASINETMFITCASGLESTAACDLVRRSPALPSGRPPHKIARSS